MKTRRFLSLVGFVFVVFSLFPSAVIAEEEERKGVAGKNFDGTLTQQQKEDACKAEIQIFLENSGIIFSGGFDAGGAVIGGGLDTAGSVIEGGGEGLVEAGKGTAAVTWEGAEGTLEIFGDFTADVFQGQWRLQDTRSELSEMGREMKQDASYAGNRIADEKNEMNAEIEGDLSSAGAKIAGAYNDAKAAAEKNINCEDVDVSSIMLENFAQGGGNLIEGAAKGTGDVISGTGSILTAGELELDKEAGKLRDTFLLDANGALDMLINVISDWDKNMFLDNITIAENLSGSFNNLATLLVMLGMIIGIGKVIITNGRSAGDLIANLAYFLVVYTLGIKLLELLTLGADALALEFLTQNQDPEIWRTKATELLESKGPIMSFIVALGVYASAFAQTIMFALRDFSLLILGSLLTFAASGIFLNFSRQWLARITTFALALLFYKPMIAFFFALSLELAKSESFYAWAGFILLILSAFMWKPLFKFFSFATPSVPRPSRLTRRNI